MQPYIYSLILLCYFAILFMLSVIINKKSKPDSFFNGDKKSPWFAVAFGMVGATLSGVTFVSVPGEVGNSSFHYFQFIMGNFVGYMFIAFVLLPFYYRKNIISIYSVLSYKMGNMGHLSTSGFFLISKIIGASFRLYLAALVIHLAITEPLNIHFGVTVFICLILIWLYTYKSGIKTVVWTDTLQTIVLIGAAIAIIVSIINQLNLSPELFISDVIQKNNHKIFDFNFKSPNNFFKQFISGIFLTIALNGFDQDIIQKNLTCKNYKKARTNMLVFSVMFVVTVFLFLIMGALLYYYTTVQNIGLPEKTDQLLPHIALNHLGMAVAIIFILGISAAAFSSADSATTALTTAFTIDFLKKGKTVSQRTRNLIHLGFNIAIFVVILFFYELNNESVVVSIFKFAGYTYGPILGIFTFSFIIPRKPISKFILPIFIISPIITYAFTLIIEQCFSNYKFGFELIIINAAITIALLLFFSKRKPNQ